MAQYHAGMMVFVKVYLGGTTNHSSEITECVLHELAAALQSRAILLSCALVLDFHTFIRCTALCLIFLVRLFHSRCLGTVISTRSGIPGSSVHSYSCFT